MIDAAKPAPRPETTRMFESDFIERFSRIHPATPFVFWVPVIFFFLYRARQLQLTAPVIAGLFAVGMLLWTLTEYVLHRYVFHWVNETSWGKRIHFVLHGVHHDFPNDKDRLVMPLGASIPLGVLIYVVFHFAVGDVYAAPLYAGMALGYLGYDGTHYAVHHFKQSSRVGKFLRRHHMLHHHADHDGASASRARSGTSFFARCPRRRSARQSSLQRCDDRGPVGRPAPTASSLLGVIISAGRLS